ncbi:hypothetical protein HIM_10779 [Hirsutella minnesotensis 3608]|uniref:NACHT domain-containing protein n=1 Tax=Hirsutella minnesotensis 3608 TaxID=1043627 RepID=A0A0F7ZFW0_9HYPO|nr:hypothetical protein HIM_10779 [Hirsutella minnesotensis 3608]
MASRLSTRLKNAFGHTKRAPVKPENRDGLVCSTTDSSSSGNAPRSPGTQTVGTPPPELAVPTATEPASLISNPAHSAAVPPSTAQSASLEPCTSSALPPPPPGQSETTAQSPGSPKHDGLDVQDAQSTQHSLPASFCSRAFRQSLQERLWNEAYDELRVNECKIVNAYEVILSTKLHQIDSTSAVVEPWENKIEQTRETRWHQMQQLVQDGLARTQKGAAVKQGIDTGLQAVQAVKEVVGKAVKAAPQAALAWVGVCLGLEILSNPVTEAGINRQGIAYVLSRMEWYWNLVCLLLDKNRDEKSSLELRDVLESNILQLYQKLLLYQIKSVCLYHRHSAAVALRDLFKLDDWGGQLKEIKDAEAAIHRDSEQHNTEQIKSYLRGLADAARSDEKKLQDIHSAIRDLTSQQEKRHQDDKNEQCLKDLYETDPSYDKKRIEETKGGLLKDSYRWILDHTDFRRFCNDPESRLLWIKGDPGKGKTMLLCGIIDEMEKESTNRLAYFFCQATETRLSNATAVLRGLIYNLARQYPPLVPYVRERYDCKGKKLLKSNTWQVLSEMLAAMLNDSILDHAIIIIDALDECNTDRPQLLDFITRSSSCVKWIVSSRNWPDIEAKLANMKQKVRLCLELNEESISGAVNVYIRHKVDLLAKEKDYDNETRNNVERHLVSNSNGTFLWVALVCQALTDPKVRKRHAVVKLRSFPPGLDSLYERMMEHVSSSEDAGLCRQILAVASVVYRPVKVRELTSLLELPHGFDDGDFEEIIGSCGSFLTLRNGVVYLVHQSAKDFLLNKAPGQIFPYGIAHQHHAIFSRSLEALSSMLRRDIYSLCAPGFPIDQVSPPYSDPLASTRYSCIYWVDHLHDSHPAERVSDGRDLRDGSAVHDFLKNKYLNWLEALSLLRSMSEGVLAVQKLEALVVSCRDLTCSQRNIEARQLAELLRDAHRFILFHRHAIEIAPLQVYASALVFSPSRSLVRGLFQKEEPDWMIRKQSMEANWNACLQTLEGHSGAVTSVVFSPDGQRLASGSEDRSIKVWDATTGACLQTLEGHGNWVKSAVFSPDGQRLASGSDDGTVKVWDAATGACLQTLEGHGDWVRSVVFAPDGQQLPSGSNDGTVKIWDAATGACLQTLEGHGDWVRSVVFAPDGQQLPSGSNDGTVKIWDAATGACLQTLEGHGDWVRSVVFAPDGQQLASGSNDGTVKIWDAATGACLQTLEGHGDWVWYATTGACLQTLEGHGDGVTSAVFSPDGQRLASGSEDRTVKAWDAATGACLQTLEGHGDWVRSVVFSPDGQRLASGAHDGTVKIWDAATGACLQTLEGHGDWVRSVVFSPDGQRLASGSHDGTVKIWDAATGACLQTLKGHGDWVRSVVFSPDGQQLASGSNDGTVKIWDAATGACLQTLEGGRAMAYLVFDPMTNSRLSTDIGVLSLDLSPAIDNQSTEEASSRHLTHCGYGISADATWIMKDRQRMLWLPQEYRALASAVMGSTVGIGCRSGRVLVMRFS